MMSSICSNFSQLEFQFSAKVVAAVYITQDLIYVAYGNTAR